MDVTNGLTMQKQLIKVLLDQNTSKIINQLTDKKDSDGNLSITKTDLTRKQFYSKLSELTNFGIIKKEKGRYNITTFGNIVLDIANDYKMRLNSAIEEYWKFKAIDLLDITDELTIDERNKIVGSLFREVNETNERDSLSKRNVYYTQYLKDYSSK